MHVFVKDPHSSQLKLPSTTVRWGMLLRLPRKADLNLSRGFVFMAVLLVAWFFLLAQRIRTRGRRAEVVAGRVPSAERLEGVTRKSGWSFLCDLGAEGVAGGSH